VIILDRELANLLRELMEIRGRLDKIIDKLDLLSRSKTTDKLAEKIIELLKEYGTLTLNEIKTKMGLRRLIEVKETVKSLYKDHKIEIIGDYKRLTGKTKIKLAVLSLENILRECYNNLVAKKTIKDAGVNIPDLWRCVQKKINVSWNLFEQTILQMSKSGIVELEEGLPGAIKEPGYLIRDKGKSYYYIVFVR